jgi:DNA-binding NarL/FixJ family response regulator
MSWRILLADNEVCVRLGIKAVLRDVPGITICGECSDGRDAIELTEKLRANIVIADPWLPRANGVILSKRILENNPAAKILIFGSIDSQLMIREFLHAGIRGLLFKTDPVADLVYAVQVLQRDQMYFTPDVQSVILNEYLTEAPSNDVASDFTKPLSLREQEVMQLLCEGKQSKEIGDELGISFRTAATHRTNLMRKLRLHNIAELTLYAISHQQLEVPRFNRRFELLEMPAPLEKSARAAA